jgi:Fic family protein
VKPNQIGAELHRFESEFRQWEEKNKNSLEVSAYLHHRLVWIHPFENGNGRWARMAANIYLHKKASPIIIWPHDLGLVKKEIRPIYIAALKTADNGDFTSLIAFHKKYQEKRG